MTGRVVRSIDCKSNDKGISMVFTFEIGSELVIEEVQLGTSTAESLLVPIDHIREQIQALCGTKPKGTRAA